MTISNNFAMAIFLFFSVNSFAGTLYSFVDDSLVGFEEDGEISGSYLAQMRGNGQSFACEFNFKTINSNRKKGVYKIKAWDKNEYSHQQANGYLYINDDDWKIRLNFPSGGCQGYPYQIFSSGNHEGIKFPMSEKKEALGLYLLNKKTSYYEESSNGFEPIKTKGNILRKDDLVGAIKKQGDFTYIEQYSWTSRAIQSSGWIKSIDLGDSLSK